MKKLIILMAVLVLVSGCCTKTVNGSVTKNPWNCAALILPTIDDKVCPTLETGKEALRASAFLWPLISTDPDIFAIWLVFDNFSKGICYAVDQLRPILAAYEGLQVSGEMGVAITVAKPKIDALKKAVSK